MDTERCKDCFGASFEDCFDCPEYNGKDNNYIVVSCVEGDEDA